jgi:hypothetical protein
VPTASLKSGFLLLNDSSRDSGFKNESLLPAKSSVSFRHSDGFIEIPVKSRNQP